MLFNGKKYEQAVIERLQMPIKICLEEQECGNAASASQLVATVPVEVKKVELSEGSEHIVKMLNTGDCLLYTSPSPRDKRQSRMPSSA